MKLEGDLAAACEAFLTFCRVEKGLAQNSLASYSLDTRQFIDFCHDRKISRIPSTADLRLYLDHLSASGKSARSIARRTAFTSETTPVDVSLCTTATAQIL